MNIFSYPLNNDQVEGLASLCFDLAKGALSIALLSTLNAEGNVLLGIVRTLIGFSMGLAFTYVALVILKLKEGK